MFSSLFTVILASVLAMQGLVRAVPVPISSAISSAMNSPISTPSITSISTTLPLPASTTRPDFDSAYEPVSDKVDWDSYSKPVGDAAWNARFTVYWLESIIDNLESIAKYGVIHGSTLATRVRAIQDAVLQLEEIMYGPRAGAEWELHQATRSVPMAVSTEVATAEEHKVTAFMAATITDSLPTSSVIATSMVSTASVSGESFATSIPSSIATEPSASVPASPSLSPESTLSMSSSSVIVPTSLSASSASTSLSSLVVAPTMVTMSASVSPVPSPTVQ